MPTNANPNPDPDARPGQPTAPGQRLGSLAAIVAGLVLVAGLLLVVGQASYKLHRTFRFSGYYSDPCLYLGGAESIAVGQGYRDSGVIGTPRITFYPPMHSLYLAAWMRGAPSGWDAYDRMAIGMGVIHGLGVLVAFGALRKGGVGLVPASLVALLVATSPFWFTHGARFMSDPMLAVLGCGLAWLWFGAGPDPRMGTMQVSATLVTVMFLTRTAALPFLAAHMAWTGFLFLRTRRPGWLLCWVMPVLAVVGWFSYLRYGYSYGGYLTSRLPPAGSVTGWGAVAMQTAEWFTVPQFFEAYSTGFYNRATFFKPPFLWVIPIAGVALMGLCCVGIRSRWERDKWAAGACLLYLLQVGVWPFPLGGRAAMVLLPWVATWAWTGLMAMTAPRVGLAGEAPRRGWGSARVTAWVGCGLLAVIAAGNEKVIVSTARDWQRRAQLAEFATMADWIRDQVPAADEIVVSDSIPRHHLHVFTGRQFLLDSRAPDRHPRWILRERGEETKSERNATGDAFAPAQAFGGWVMLRRDPAKGGG